MSGMASARAVSRRSLRIWAWAAFGAMALHGAALAFVIATARPDDPPDDLGANAIEVGYERLAPKAEPVDLPAGPNSEASAASPAVAEQKDSVKDTNLPQATPTDTADPDRIVTPDDRKKPVE